MHTCKYASEDKRITVYLHVRICGNADLQVIGERQKSLTAAGPW